ncbi:MAG: hypothetical protein ACFCVE_14715 [Phycisphaerae bacterium]
MTTPANSQLVQLLTRQVECYRDLLKLSDVQSELVRQGRDDELLEVLARRQGVMDRVSDIDARLSTAKADWPAAVARLDEEARASVEALVGTSRQLLEQITAADASDAMLLQQRRMNVGRELRQASQGKQLNRSYAAAAYARPDTRLDLQQ